MWWKSSLMLMLQLNYPLDNALFSYLKLTLFTPFPKCTVSVSKQMTYCTAGAMTQHKTVELSNKPGKGLFLYEVTLRKIE